MEGSDYRTSANKEIKMKKLNCWEFRKCGREPGGINAHLGVCPASTEKGLDGEHGGKNAGRTCWIVAGTLCNGEIQGTFAGKIDSCFSCDFYLAVKREEYPGFQIPGVLLGKINRAKAHA